MKPLKVGGKEKKGGGGGGGEEGVCECVSGVGCGGCHDLVSVISINSIHTKF